LILFYALFVYIAIILLLTFNCMGRIFDRLKVVSEDHWRDLGSPIIKLSLNPFSWV